MSAKTYDDVGYPFNLIDAIYCDEIVWVDDEDHIAAPWEKPCLANRQGIA